MGEHGAGTDTLDEGPQRAVDAPFPQYRRDADSMGYPSLMSSATWLPTLITSALSGSIGVVGVLTGSWLTARREDARQGRENEREQDRWHREDERRWAAQRRAVYAHYLDAVRPWMRHVRRWTGPYWEPDTTTKEGLQNEEGTFDWNVVSDDIHALESELTLIGSENVREAARWLHAQLFAFEATLIASGLEEISVMGKNCELPYNRLVWAFRTDLGVSTPEPSVKPPSKDHLSKRDSPGVGVPSPGTQPSAP